MMVLSSLFIAAMLSVGPRTSRDVDGRRLCCKVRLACVPRPCMHRTSTNPLFQEQRPGRCQLPAGKSDSVSASTSQTVEI